jgi:photosystem I P700 chlorophyll a apoprotein A2
LSVGSFVHLALFSLQGKSSISFELGDSDAVNAFGTADTALLIQPNLATSVQSSTRQQGGFVESLYSVCSADLLVHHALALGVHTAALILPRDAFDASGSHLLADDTLFCCRHDAFDASGSHLLADCDEPGRGGS